MHLLGSLSSKIRAFQASNLVFRFARIGTQSARIRMTISDTFHNEYASRISAKFGTFSEIWAFQPSNINSGI